MSHGAFVRCVCEHPGDDTPRLVFADWLQDHDEPDRAEFIRLQCHLHPYQHERDWLERLFASPWAADEEPPGEHWGAVLRALEPLVLRHAALCEQYVRECGPWSRTFIRGLVGRDWLRATAPWYWGWSRGFVSHVTFGLPDFTTHAARLFALQPVERVALSGVVRDGIVFRAADGHHSDIGRTLWERLQMPRCEAGGECRLRGTHAHMTEDALSVRLVAHGRRLAELPEITPPSPAIANS